ncbi:PEP-CTERM/exosortase system-associated acyltransferase [Roseateles sp. BYS96W]|uniref:PEP-CTERM/exosortase system-associated acyltransferase n=1 Tax=Pelomonas nitida TaxID=3299027 RepID=A0ABW7G1C9_9BURK
MNTTSIDGNLGSKFEEWFELTPALDRGSLELVHRIRHDVYCRDLGWEPVRPSGLEIDAYDQHAFHCLLKKRGTGVPVGCTRVIIANPANMSEPLPFEMSCRDVLNRELVDPARLPRDAVCEVSRLAVMNTFRQRKGETSQAASISNEDFQSRASAPRFPFIPVSLYLGATAIARRLGIANIFVLTEPRLASHFSRIGFDLQVIGGEIDHRGKRVPSLMTTSKIIKNLRPMIQPLYQMIERSVEAAFLEHPEALHRTPVLDSPR